LALQRAQDAGLDLVEMNPNSEPPICKIMDYGKYKFEKERKKKEARKKQKVIHIKEVKVRPKIGEHDLDFKLKNAISFLERGDKVKMVVMFRGREIMHYDLGVNLMEKIIELLAEYGTPESNMKKEGRDLIVFFVPIKKKSKPKEK